MMEPRTILILVFLDSLLDGGIPRVQGIIYCPSPCTCTTELHEVMLNCNGFPCFIPPKTARIDFRITGMGNDIIEYPLWAMCAKGKNKESIRIGDVLPPTWMNVKTLCLDDQTGGYFTLSNKTFSGLNNVKQLKIVRIRQIPPGIFDNMRSLDVLDLSDNHQLHLDTIVLAMFDLRFAKLSILNLSRTNGYLTGSSALFLGEQMSNALSLASVRILDISWAGTIFIDSSGRSTSFQSLEVLNISHTTVAVRKTYANMQSLPIEQIFPKLRHLVYEDFVNFVRGSNRLKLGTCRKDLRHFDLLDHCITRGSNVALPYHLETGRFDNTKELHNVCAEISHNSACVNQNNSLMLVSFVNCGLIGWNAAIYGLNKLETLDLTNNKLEIISIAGLRYYVNLKHLLLGMNNLWKYQYNETFENILMYSIELRELDLSNNNLSYIPRNMFKYNTKLRLINFSRNKLTTLSFHIKQFDELVYLDLSNNIINALGNYVIDEFQEYYNVYRQPFVNLSNNKMTCSCGNKQFVTAINDMSYVFASYTDYTCLYKGDERLIDLIDQSVLTKDCLLELLIIILPTLVSVCFVCGFIIWLYIRRLYLRKLYVRYRFWRYRHTLVNIEDRIFLAYSHHDKDIVLRSIYPEMNRRLQTLLNTEDDVVYINDKDFRLPGVIDEEIVRAVHTCRCTVALISKHFLDSAWSKLETLYSWYKKRPIILVFLENIKEDELDGLLKYLYNKNVRLMWTEDEGLQDIFWTNVLEGLTEILIAR